MDKSDKEDMATVVIDDVSYQINEKLEEWIKAICITKIRSKKEDKLKKHW